jgi:hypothetical protein
VTGLVVLTSFHFIHLPTVNGRTIDNTTVGQREDIGSVHCVSGDRRENQADRQPLAANSRLDPCL